MNQALIVILSLLLGGVIVAVETNRRGVRGHLDGLRIASALYFICFSVFPLCLQVTDLPGLQGSAWQWMFRIPFRDEVFVLASCLAAIGYPCLLLGYWGTRRLASPGPGEASAANGRPVHRLYAVLVGLGLGGIGLAALAIYTRSIGGLEVLLVQGLAFRSAEVPVITPWAFLKNVSPLVLGATFLLNAARRYYRARAARGLILAAVTICFAASVVILFHQAGRAGLLAFLLTFGLSEGIRRNRLRGGWVALGVVAFVVLLFAGKELFFAAQSPFAIWERLGQLSTPATSHLDQALAEFGFPYVTLANVVDAVPGQVSFRWFYDVPLAVAYLLPKRLLGISLDPTVSMAVSGLFGTDQTNPADLLSFGYFSAGVAGVLLVATGFGAVLALLDRWLPASADPVRATLRACWALLLGPLVMYGDPQHLWIPGFWLMVTTTITFLPRWLSPRVERRPATAAPEWSAT